MKYPTKIFIYNELELKKADLIEELRQEGFIGIKNVPNFSEVYQSFFYAAREFMLLPEEEKNKYTPTNHYISGWSFGTETYNNLLDVYKGSYYANYPNIPNNIWPHLHNFKESYLGLSKLLFELALKVSVIVGCYSGPAAGIARMLYYVSPRREEIDSNPNWHGVHRDHSLFTCLCPAIYLSDGEIVQQPINTGLVIQGKEVVVEKDIVLLQVGEAAELISNGKITATDHFVKKSPPGYERYTFVLFLDAAPNVRIYSNITKYNDRYIPGMTYHEWSLAPFKKYHQ